MKWNLSRGLDIHSALRALLMLCTGLLVTIVSFEQPAAAFTTIPQSHISSTTIWSSAASPYIITGDVTIDNGGVKESAGVTYTLCRLYDRGAGA